jgi:hypothetical protein
MIQYLKIIRTVFKGQIYAPSMEKKVAGVCGKAEEVCVMPEGVCTMQEGVCVTF